MGAKRISAEARFKGIRNLLEQTQNVSVPELAKNFKVSEMTIRRDLEKLEANNEVKRVHGGAMIAERRAFEIDFRGKRQKEREAKTAIAKEAAKLVKPGHRLILDNGTTTLQLATELKRFKDLTIITTSLAVASELQFANFEIILMGGSLREGSPHLTGMLTEHSLEILHADIVFQGADAIDQEGTMFNEDMMMAQADRKMRLHADMCCIIADSTKTGKSALARNGSLKDVDYFITDNRLDSELYKTYSKLGVKVIRVGSNKPQKRSNDTRK